MSDESILRELARLRRDVDDIKAILSPSTSQTTKAQREDLRKHIEDLDAELRFIKKPKQRRNSFKIGDIVRSKSFQGDQRTRGKVSHIACKLAIPSKRKSVMKKISSMRDDYSRSSSSDDMCSPEKCKHKDKSHVWVVWPDGKHASYHFGKLKAMTEDELKPRIGRELSGKIGPWSYDVATKLWDRDGKTYTETEANDIMYWETHSGDKDESEEFLKSLRGVKK